MPDRIPGCRRTNSLEHPRLAAAQEGERSVRPVQAIKHLLTRALESDALQQVAGRLRSGERALAVAGVSGGARALVLAHAILAEDRPVLALAAGADEARILADDLGLFLGLLSPNPPAVVCLPSFEVDPYRGLSPHPDILASRAHALWRLLEDKSVVCVASIRAAAARLPARSRFLSRCLQLREGGDCGLEETRRRLRNAGYVEDDPVTEPGEFSLRGGILDVFPPQMEKPVRVEFFGDSVESLRIFDPESQRSVSQVKRAEIIPMRENCPDENTLRRWAEEAESRWGAGRESFLEEEIARAREGETFSGFEFLLPLADPLTATIFDYAAGCRLAWCDREVLDPALARYHAELYARFVDRVEAAKPAIEPGQVYLAPEELAAAAAPCPSLDVQALALEGNAAQIFVSAQGGRKYHGNIKELVADLRRFREAGQQVAMIFSNLGRAERVRDILGEYGIPCRLCHEHTEAADLPAGGEILLGLGALHSGFLLPAAGLHIIAGPDVFDEIEVKPGPLHRKKAARNLFLSDFRDLKPGDYVVHTDHGIGLFESLKNIDTPEGPKEFVVLRYQDEARLYVPVERLDLIQKYSGAGGAHPALDKLGGTSWSRTKSRIRRSMRDMAAELLKLYAARQTVEGHAFAADTNWQREFEDAFEFTPTRDQEDAIEATKLDMEAPRPMDRLLCGDVGYGKTEVAMRAAFKAAMDGKQVALLAPTTVLAFQHYHTFRRRFTAFPLRIELLSRFRSQREQKQVLAALELGTVDIAIGTHRLLSKDVSFRDLGLVVVDEEQRFGVTHKERLKALKTRVDVLTLSATPIPRTLHMAMLGLRDMSTIETPPKNRLAIQTSVLRHSQDAIRSAIELELARNGQVYYVHNRVETIYSVAAMVQKLVPGARIGVAHGQMPEAALEKVMMQFVQDELDILVATTIIENGLDIPRVNTIIIDRADLYGMSQLYQLRGRVGRSDRRAYAYLLIPSEEVLSDIARKRLAAIREFSDLGTGFRVAALDLEIRGAGNLLGGEQHGHINAIGFDLYCRLLEQAVEELRGTRTEEEVCPAINLRLDIRIPDEYLPDQGQRLRMYKRISSARDEAELDALRQEMVDRFGSYPEAVDNLFRYAALQQRAHELQIQAIERNRDQVFFRFVDHSRVSPQRLLGLASRNRQASLSPQGLLTLEIGRVPPDILFDSLHSVLDQIREA